MINLRHYFYSEFEKFIDDEDIVRSNTGIYIGGVYYDGIDLEAIESSDLQESLNLKLKSISNEVLIKIIFKKDYEYKIDDTSYRSKEINALGFTNKSLIILFQSKSLESIKEIFNLFKDEKKLEKSELKSLFDKNSEKLNARINSVDIDNGIARYGSVRLKNPNYEAEFSPFKMGEFLGQLPSGCEVVLNLKKLNSVKAEILIKSKKNKLNFIQNNISEIEDKLINSGESIYEYEFLVLYQSTTEEALRVGLREIYKLISQYIGIPIIETFGNLPAQISGSIGGEIYISLYELGYKLSTLFPIYFYGSVCNNKNHKYHYPLHRLDYSLYDFNLFNTKYSSFNLIISGKSGSGKSVFGNALTQSILNQKNVDIIKIDVGGSYKKECEDFQGTEIEFSLDKPSGLDPFKEIKYLEKSNPDLVSILSEFIKCLVIEENEGFLKKSEHQEIEDAVTHYVENSKNPSFNDFLDSLTGFSRLQSLKRFGKNGVYRNAFLGECENFKSKYTYYNFSSIINAGNLDFSNALIAGVIARLNLRLIDKENKNRLVLFVDEVKFFIESQSRLFLLTSANFRKYGHSVVTIFQNIEDSVFLKSGRFDQGLLLNSPIRVLFNTSADSTFLKDYVQLSDSEIRLLKNKNRRRLFLLQDDLGTRACELILTPSEYWFMSSTKKDNDKLNEIRNQFPYLKINQVIELLRMTEA